jgi:hypothetical protein
MIVGDHEMGVGGGRHLLSRVKVARAGTGSERPVHGIFNSDCPRLI